MSETLKSYLLPDKMACPSCGTLLVGASPVSGSTPKGFRKGNISICYNCSSVLIVGDSSFSLMTREQINALDDTSKRVIDMTVQSIRRTLESKKKR